MAEPTLNATFNDIAVEVGNFLGYGRTYASFSAGQLTHITDVIKSGYSQFLNPPAIDSRPAHEWNFLKPTAQLTFSAPYSTGTITIVSGVVTGSGTTFPAASASYVLTTGGASYSVASYSSGTSITLDDTSVNVSAGASYSLHRVEYEMPDDFGHMIGELYYEPASGIGLPIELVSEGRILAFRSIPTAIETGRPLYYALRSATTDGTESSHKLLLPWPLSDAAYIANYRYRVNPDALAATKYAYGGPAHRETLIESCLAVAERRFESEEGVHNQAFLRLLTASISFDNRTQPDSLGYNCDASMRQPVSPRTSRPTTYLGQVWTS